MITYDVKFITSNESLTIKNNDIITCKYETKKRSDESVFDHGKRDYVVRRGGHWRAPHPRHLKRLEAKLRDQSVVHATWMTDSLISLVFSSGTIAYLTVKLETRDVTNILFDRYFVGKLAGQLVTNVAICKSHMLFTHNDKSATLVSFGKSCSTVPCRISDRDPSLHCIELGGVARRTERLLSSCDTPNGARILVWSVAGTEPAPWSPISAIEDLANLHLYQITGNNISLLAYHQLENETLSAELSENEDLIHVVEQTSYQKNGVRLEWIRLEAPGGGARAARLQARDATRVRLGACARAARRDAAGARLLLACIDGSLHLVHRDKGLLRSVRAGFVASSVWWVGSLALAAAEAGRLQVFDRALQLLHQHARCLDLTQHARSGPMRVWCWRAARGGPALAAGFAGGPLALLRLAHPALLTAWIRQRRLTSAVALLQQMDWEREGAACLWAVNKLLCEALRGGAEVAEAERAAQGALGAFLAPRADLGPRAERYRASAHDLARKFFHHLLRRGRIEKAMRLGVDLGAWDLFADARWAARARALPGLAAEAGARAASLRPDSESGSCSSCSSRAGSPPPPAARPRPRPPLPALPPPPPRPASIRPNLHQYLERDATIWSSEVADCAPTRELKPILTTQGSKWNDAFKGKLEVHKPVDSVPRREACPRVLPPPRTLYRYRHGADLATRAGDPADLATARAGDPADQGRRNKVKFSDTVTIAVVARPPARALPAAAAAARELAASLPLGAPHNYLAAFTPLPAAPAPPAAGTSALTVRDYVEV